MSPFDHDTVLDFWRLIYQQCIETIVMTTNVVEGGIVKCAQYWPPCGAEVRTFGHFLLQTVEERVYADFVIRKIKLKVETDRYCRDVTQFHFTSWPEHGVPASPVTWLDMRYKVSVHHADKLSPILVHCGTGVSRSAAYIAIDALIGQYEQEGGVSVFSYVQSMRRDRPMMVRCLDQYVFIYLALQEDFEAGDTNIDVQDGISNTLDSLHTLNPRTGHTFLEDQFELLNLFTLDILSKDWTVARQLDKRKARVDGRFPQSFLPSNESGQPCKSYPLLDTVFIDGHRKRNKIVTLTTSLDDKSTVQFWRFVCEHNITTIIQLGRDSMEHRDTNINKKKSGSSKKSGLLTDDTVGDCDVTFRSETLSLHQYGAVHVRDVQLEMLRAGKKTYVKIRFFSLPHHRFHCASYEKTRRRSWASGKVGQKEESSSNSVEKDEDDDDQDGDKDREDEGSEDDEEEEEEETISEEDETDEGECNDIQKKTRASAYKIKALHDVYNQQKQRASSYSIQPNVDSRPHQRRSSYPGEYMSRQHRYSLSKSRRSAKDKFTQKADGGIWRFVQKVKGMTRSKSGTRDGGRRNEEKRGRDRIRERRDDAPSRRRWRSFAKRRTNDPREYRHSDWRERERDAYRRSQQSTRGQSRRNFSPERQSLKNAKMNAKGRFWPYQRDLNRGRNNYTRESETVSKHKLPPAWAKRSSRQMTSRGSYNTNRSASSGRSRDNRDGQRSMAQRMMKVYTSSHTNSQMGRTTHLASDRIFHTWREDNKYTYHSTSLTNLNHSNSALFSPCRYTNNCLARKASSTSSLCESKSLYQRSSDNRVRIEDFRANNSVTVFDEIKSCLTNSRQTKLSRSKSSSDILVVAKAGNVTDIIEELETPFPKMTSVSMNDLVTLEFHDNKLYYSQQNLPQNKITKKSKLARGSNIRWKFSKGITSAFNGSTDQDNEHSRNAVYVSTIQDSKHTKKAGYLIQDVGWTAFQKSEHVQSVQNESNLSLQAECEQRTGKLPYTEVNTVENKRKKNRCGWPSGNKGRASHEKREKLSSELHRDRNDNSSARRERKQTTKTKVKFRRRSQAGQTNRCLPHVSPGLVLELLESALDWHCTPLKEWARTRTQTPGKAWSGPQTSPILIHSPGDSGAANLLCACALVCERVQEENMVDVYHVIKHLRRRRPWAVECYAQYEFIHECLYNYVTEYMDDVTFTDRWIYRGVKDTSYRPAIEDSACPASPQWQRRAPNITLNARVHNVNTHDSFVAGTSVTEITGADGNSGNDVTHHNGNARSGLYAVDAKSAAADTELSPTKIQLCPDKEVFSPPPGVIHMTTKSQVQQMTQEADSGHIENVVLNSGQNHTKDGHDAVATRGRHLQLGENPMCSLLWENETEEESSPTKVSAYEGENEDQADNVIREDMPTNFGSEGVDGQMDSREIIFSQPMQMEVDDENVDENDDDMLCASVLEDTDHASIDDPTSDLHRADETSITVIQELERSLLSGNSPEF